MRIRCSERSEKGFSLVDVVMAIALLGVMAGGILGSFRYGFLALQLVRENQRATQILLEKVETVRLYNWDQVTKTGFIPATFTDVYDPQGGTNSSGTTYAGTLAIANCPSGPGYFSNMRLLTITLSWTTRAIPHTRTLSTYIAQDGLQNYVY
jgi:type II secretory pathway pseudopilin PulG